MFELMRSHLLSIAALSGDLYALGVLPATDMCQMASLLVYDLRTLTHTRALHLLLLRASTGARQHLPRSLLCLWRERLVCLARGWGVFFVRDVTRRWLIVSASSAMDEGGWLMGTDRCRRYATSWTAWAATSARQPGSLRAHNTGGTSHSLMKSYRCWCRTHSADWRDGHNPLDIAIRRWEEGRQT